MKKNVALSMMLLGGVLLASSASAESAQEKETWAHQDQYLSGALRDANKDCEVTPKAPIVNQWDKASFANQALSGTSGHSPSSYCAGVYNSVRSLCSGLEEAKKPVQDQIKRVVCRYGGKGKFGLSLSGGTLTYNIDWDESGINDKIHTFMKKSLVTSSGDTIQEVESWKHQDSYLSRVVDDANKRCEIDPKQPIVNRWDKASFKTEDWSHHAPNSACALVYNDLGTVCAGPNASVKTSVQRKIKTIVCRNGGKGKFGLSLSGGVLTYNIDWDEKSVDDKITAFLKQNL